MPAWGRGRNAQNAGAGVLTREVGAEIETEIGAPTTLEFQIAVARQPGLQVDEALTIMLNGDATCLAPRQAMVRIATGRDAADTAFLDNHDGAITLTGTTVTAVVDGELPRDSVDQLVSLR